MGDGAGWHGRGNSRLKCVLTTSLHHRQAIRAGCIAVELDLCHFCNEKRNKYKNYKNSKVAISLSDHNKDTNTTSDTRNVRVARGEIDSQELFQSERELLIRHGTETYRLRRTGLNKLILTK